MDLNLKDKVVLITGGSRGIGFSCAKAFAKEGAKVVITATTKEKAEEVAADINKEFGVETLGLMQNASDSISCKDAVLAVIAKFSKIDILVNNAGITRDKFAIQMDDKDWVDVINTNLSGVFYTSREAARYMLKARSGCIINMSSVVGKNGSASQANYASAKAGVIGLTKALAKEFAQRGVRVNAVAPGYIETDMTSVLPKQISEMVKSMTPLNRYGHTEDVANAVLFLASSVSSYVTGELIAVDGGMSM